LEKSAQAVLKFFVFEPNTFTTRSRVAAALTPIFEQARLNEGLYDYAIVCDERNNTPSSIDNNELRVSLYIQPVRTAEFILADFIATRTGVNFEEILS
jgi:phage tail sheath protein FI